LQNFLRAASRFFVVEIKLRNRVVLVITICRPPNTSVVYHLLNLGDYGLQALEKIFSNILPLGEVCLLGGFNVDLQGSWISKRCLCDIFVAMTC
jgi:hypothetical protein